MGLSREYDPSVRKEYAVDNLPVYNFKFSGEIIRTFVLFLIVSVLIAFYGIKTADITAWTAHDWKLFGYAQLIEVLHFGAYFLITLFTGSKPPQGFSK